MFSQTLEYALRAVVALAAVPEQRAIKTRDISALTQVPPDYLFKVLRSLSKAGLVETTRGVSGGVKLARPPGEIKVLEVIQVVDPMPRIKKCPLNLAAHRECLCALHQRLDEAMAGVEDAFSSVTLEELAQDPTGQGPFGDRVCASPQKAGRKPGGKSARKA